MYLRGRMSPDVPKLPPTHTGRKGREGEEEENKQGKGSDSGENEIFKVGDKTKQFLDISMSVSR